LSDFSIPVISIF